VSDRGAKALAERLNHYIDYASDLPSAILGTTGLFIADVSKHEPLYGNNIRGCRCGWKRGYDPNGFESYFDHLAESAS
jgi:hypothetical protein